MAIATNALRPHIIVANGTATSFTLPTPADYVNAVVVVAGGATSFAATEYTVVATAPSADQVQFNGAPGTPGQTLTFETAPAANSLILVQYIPSGSL
jgi:hypothetical protein